MGSVGASKRQSGTTQQQSAVQQIDPNQQTITAQQAQQANNQAFSDTDNSPFHELKGGRQYFQNQTLSIDSELARQDYLNAVPETGSLYSASQNLNWALTHDLKLTANQQFMDEGLSDAMHNLGQNLNLTRYDHMGGLNDLIKQSGFSGSYENYTESQLRSMLVGSTYVEKGYVSTSYNDFKNAPSNNPFTDREVIFRYQTPAGVQAFMPGRGPGGDFGEIILNKKQNYQITGLRFTGKYGRNKASLHKQIEIFVTVSP